MANRERPRCPTCAVPMAPVFRKGARGKAFVRVPDTFYCIAHDQLARGRRNTKYL